MPVHVWHWYTVHVTIYVGSLRYTYDPPTRMVSGIRNSEHGIAEIHLCCAYRDVLIYTNTMVVGFSMPIPYTVQVVTKYKHLVATATVVIVVVRGLSGMRCEPS